MIEKGSLPNKVFKNYGIELHPIKPFDLRCLRQWRNSSGIRIQMLDSSVISARQQRLWYEKIIKRLDQVHWVVWCKGVRTGYLNIKGVNTDPIESQKILEPGMYVGDSSVRHGLLGYAISLLSFDIAFEYFSARECQSWVKEDRVKVRHFDKQLGYKEKGTEKGFVKLSLCYPDYKISKEKLIRYFN